MPEVLRLVLEKAVGRPFVVEPTGRRIVLIFSPWVFDAEEYAVEPLLSLRWAVEWYIAMVHRGAGVRNVEDNGALQWYIGGVGVPGMQVSRVSELGRP